MKAELFSRDNCPYCVKAKELLEERGIEYDLLMAADHREALIERVTAITGSAPKTVPQIFLDGQYIGGYTELAAHLE